MTEQMTPSHTDSNAGRWSLASAVLAALAASGSIREDRIVLPIPPGTHWSDAKPLILPAAELPVVSG